METAYVFFTSIKNPIEGHAVTIFHRSRGYRDGFATHACCPGALPFPSCFLTCVLYVPWLLIALIIYLYCLFDLILFNGKYWLHSFFQVYQTGFFLILAVFSFAQQFPSSPSPL